MFAGNFAPRGWALCDGQLLAISQNDALFSLLGTLYGGDGRTTFALPDLRGRVPIHAGSGPGLIPRNVGAKGGSEEVALSAAELPPHSHTLQGSTDLADSPNPEGRLVAASTTADLYILEPPAVPLEHPFHHRSRRDLPVSQLNGPGGARVRTLHR
jgi:microcystin-dependent protein